MSTFRDSNDFEKAIFRKFPLDTCNGFGFAYQDEHPNAVVIVGETETGTEHCWVYDPGLNLTIDPTLKQFDEFDAGYWEGKDHPHCEAWDEYHDKEAFNDDWEGFGSPFITR